MANVYLNTGALSLYSSANGTDWAQMSGSSPYTLAVNTYYKLTATPPSGQILAKWTLENNTDNIITLSNNYTPETIFNTLEQTWDYTEDKTIIITPTYVNEDNEYLNKRGLKDVVERLRDELSDANVYIKESFDYDLQNNSINYYERGNLEISNNARLQYLLANPNMLTTATNGNNYTIEEIVNATVPIEQVIQSWFNYPLSVMGEQAGSMISGMAEYIQSLESDTEQSFSNWPNNPEPSEDYIGIFNSYYHVTTSWDDWGQRSVINFIFPYENNLYTGTVTYAWVGGDDTGAGYQAQVSNLSLLDPSSITEGSRLEYLAQHPEMLEQTAWLTYDETSDSFMPWVDFVDSQSNNIDTILTKWCNEFNYESYNAAYETISASSAIDDNKVYQNQNWNWLYSFTLENIETGYLLINNELYEISIENLNDTSKSFSYKKITLENSFVLLKKDNQIKELPYVKRTGDTMTGSLNIINNSSLIIGSQPAKASVGANTFSQGNLAIATASGSHAEGEGTIAIGQYSHAEGHTSAIGKYSHAEGYSNLDNPCLIELQEREGYSGQYWVNCDFKIPSPSSMITYIKFMDDDSLYEIQDVWEDDSYRIGQMIRLPIGGKKTCTVWYIQQQNAFGDYSHTEGYDTIAINEHDHAEGYRTVASGGHSHAEGYRTTASGGSSHAEGYSTTASGSDSHAEGASTVASGYNSHAEGESTTASGGYSHAEGYRTTASGSNSHTEGTNSIAAGNITHAEGNYTVAYGEASHAEGGGGTNWNYSRQISGAANTRTYTIADTKSLHVGDVVVYKGNKSIITSLVENTSITLHQTLSKDTALENASVVIYWIGASMGRMSHTEGCITKALAYADHAEGCYTVASGSDSHAEGWQTTASAQAAHAEGVATIASGSYAHSEGDSTTASGEAAHAEGTIATASGKFSHTEGYYTTASGEAAHAEGRGGAASGIYSHIENGSYFETHNITGNKKATQYTLTGEVFVGQNIYYSSSTQATILTASYNSEQNQTIVTVDQTLSTSALNNYAIKVYWPNSHIASGDYSHAEGISTIAQRLSQHVEGTFNLADAAGTVSTKGTYAHIIGNGTTDNARSNAATVAWNGEAWFQGDVYVGSTSGTNKDVGSKKLATEDYVRNLLQEFATLNNLNMPS